MEEKRCPRCGETKPVSEYHKDKGASDGLYGYCKECNKAKARAWTAANPEKAREQAKKRTRERRNRPARLRSKYNLTMAQYEALLLQQGGTCAICGAAEPGRGDLYFPIDHDHTSNQVRGLLCHSCNRGIGLLQDSAEVLKRAHAYLLNPPYQPS